MWLSESENLRLFERNPIFRRSQLLCGKDKSNICSTALNSMHPEHSWFSSKALILKAYTHAYQGSTIYSKFLFERAKDYDAFVTFPHYKLHQSNNSDQVDKQFLTLYPPDMTQYIPEWPLPWSYYLQPLCLVSNNNNPNVVALSCKDTNLPGLGSNTHHLYTKDTVIFLNSKSSYGQSAQKNPQQLYSYSK
jgi:hypothetical protein